MTTKLRRCSALRKRVMMFCSSSSCRSSEDAISYALAHGRRSMGHRDTAKDTNNNTDIYRYGDKDRYTDNGRDRQTYTEIGKETHETSSIQTDCPSLPLSICIRLCVCMCVHVCMYMYVDIGVCVCHCICFTFTQAKQ